MSSNNDFDTIGLQEEVKVLYEEADPAHDFSHIIRVYQNAQIIGKKEGADMQVLLFSALLHDAGSVSKGLEDSIESYQRQKAVLDFLIKKELPENVQKKVLYAIEVHRFSKGIVPDTLEARILQDADRLDALGAVGIARVFMTGGTLGRALYDNVDPFCKNREPDDKKWNLDHFYRKLLKLESGMHTKTAKDMASRRTEVLKRYLSDLEQEIEGNMNDEINCLAQ
ncbi:MAG: HD domain-containing protein [Methanothrix sp.]|nr:HD domain-containing protein [Methanothrix sp.]